MPTIVDAPRLDTVEPAAHQVLVPLGDEVVDAAPKDGDGGEDVVIGDVSDWALSRETVQDDGGANGTRRDEFLAFEPLGVGSLGPRAFRCRLRTLRQRRWVVPALEDARSDKALATYGA